MSFSVEGISPSYTVDPVKVAASYLTVTAPTPSGGTATKKIQPDLVVVAQNGSNATVTLEFKPHADNPLFAPLVYVSTADTAVTLTMPASTITGTGGGNAAISGTSVTNSSTLTYPKDIAVWATVPRQRVTSSGSTSFDLEVAAFSANGIASVSFYRSGTTSGGSSTLLGTATSMTVATTPAWLVSLGVPAKCYLYRYTVDASNTTTYPDGPHYFDFKTSSTIGTSGSSCDTRPVSPGLNDTLGAGQLLLFTNSGGTRTESIKYISTTGNDSTGNGTLGNPYRTAAVALSNLASQNGGRIICLAGTYAGSDLEVSGVSNSEWLTIEGDPTGSNTAVTWAPSGTVWVYGSGGHIRFKHMAMDVPNSGGTDSTDTMLRGGGTISLWVDDTVSDGGCRYCGGVMASSAHGWADFGLAYFTNSRVMNVAGVAGYCDMVRNVRFDTTIGDCFQNSSVLINTAGDDVASSGNGSDIGLHADWLQMNNPQRNGNLVYYQNTVTDFEKAYGDILNAGGNGLSRIGVVGLLGHMNSTSGNYTVFGGADHVLFWDVTLYNEGFAWGYLNYGTYTWSVRNCSLTSYANVVIGSGVYQAAWGNNMNLQSTGFFGSLDTKVTDVTTESSDSVLYTSVTNRNFKPAPSSPLRNRVAYNAPLVSADAQGVVYRRDGTDPIGALRGFICCNQDFNGDGAPGTDQDIEAFYACLNGDCCDTCGSADFNCDGIAGDQGDLDSFFSVLSGGPC